MRSQAEQRSDDKARTRTKATQGAFALAVLAWGVGTACAPVYIPGAFNVPQLEAARDVHASAQVGTQGYQGNAAVAITDNIAVRGSGQYSSASSQDSSTTYAFRRGQGGVAFFWAKTAQAEEGEYPEGMRASLGLDFGGGTARGTGRLTPESTPLVASGSFLRSDLQADIGWEWKHASVGVVGRAVYFRLTHDRNSDNPGKLTNFVMIEPGAVARVGARNIKLEGQFGFSVPVYADEVFFWIPIIVSLGVVGDF